MEKKKMTAKEIQERLAKCKWADMGPSCDMMFKSYMGRIHKTLSWLVPDCKGRYDECRGNLEPGSQGGYSVELTEAIELLKEIEDCLRVSS
jgi:hypothetical protein